MSRKLFDTLSLEWSHLRTQRTWIAYVTLGFLMSLATTLLMEFVIVGAEKGWTADMQRSFWLRNWMLLPLGYCWLSIQSFVNDVQQGFVAESIVAGHSRRNILLSKVCSLLGITGLSLFGVVLPTLFFFDGDIAPTTLMSLPMIVLSDIVIIGWIALFANSSSNKVLLKVVLLFAVDFLSRLLLWILPNLIDNTLLSWAGETLPLYFPSTILTSWMLWEDAWTWHSLGVTLGYAVVLWTVVYGKWRRTVF